jgi:predicted nicotinamide N-methyase
VVERRGAGARRVAALAARSAGARAGLRPRAAEHRRRTCGREGSGDAIRASADNARRNGVEIETAIVAWDAPEPIVERAPWRWVLASDVLYEQRNVELLLELLPRLVDRGGEVLIADPSRRPAERFLELAQERWELRTSVSPRAARAQIHHLRLRPRG